MTGKSRRGRPSVHKEPRHLTSIAVSESHREFLEMNNLNLTEMVWNLIESMKNQENFKIHEMEQKINKMKMELKILQDEYNKMVLEEEEREEIRRSQRVANEYEAYYLRKLVLQGSFEIRTSPDFLKVLKTDEKILPYFDIDEESRTLLPKEGKEISRDSVRILKNSGAIQKEDTIYIPPPKKYLIGKPSHLVIEDEDLLVKEMEERFIDEDLLPGYFVKFHPKITDAIIGKRIKEEYSEWLRKGTSKIQFKHEGDQDV